MAEKAEMESAAIVRNEDDVYEVEKLLKTSSKFTQKTDEKPLQGWGGEVAACKLRGGGGGNSKSSTRLVRAVDAGNVDRVTALLRTPTLGSCVRRGVSPGIVEDGGWTPLIKAADNGNEQIVKLLIEREAPLDNTLNKNKQTALPKAANKGHTAIVEKLIAAGADVNKSDSAGFTPLITAADNGNEQIVKLLVDNGAPLENVVIPSALYKAAINGHCGIVTTLVQAGARVNTHDWAGFSPLHAASQEGHMDTVRSLLRLGADKEIKDEDGRRPLGDAAYKGHLEVLELLIQEGANVNQGNNNGKTPLMLAAQYGHNHCVRALIQHGADVNQVDTDGDVALVYAVEEKLEDTAVLLLSETDISKVGKNVMHRIGRKGLRRVCEEFLNKLESEDTDILKRGLEGAAEFGEAEVARMILGNVKDEHVRVSMARSVMELAVYSDRESVVKVILKHLDKVDGDVVDLVVKRKVCEVVDAFLEDEHKPKLKDSDIIRLECLSTKSVREKAEELINVTKIPKSVEFEYFSTPDALLKLLKQDKVSIEEAVSVLKAKDVHINFKEQCGKDCKQPQICQYFRESNDILQDIVKRLGDKAEIFRGTTVEMVGSILEGTRIGASDEIDSSVTLDKNWKQYFSFDSVSQQLRVDCKGNARMTDIFAPYISSDGTFNGSKYMDDFLEAVYEIIKLYEQDKSALPESCEQSRKFLQLSVSYTPCPLLECVDTKYGTTIFTRCRHTYDQNNEPTVCFSKVGIVLHLGWKKPGATEWDHRMDVDLTCPRIPTTDRYDGNIGKIEAFLMKHKCVGWLEECNKLTVTGGAVNSPHLADATTWPVQCRRINTEDVIPRQALIFMSDKTLKGPKRKVYILLKILKIITDSTAKSYQVKYSLDDVYGNSLPDEEKIGEAALSVMDFNMIKGKFESLHTDLQKAGYCGVDLDTLKSGYIKLIRQKDSDAPSSLQLSSEGKVKEIHPEVAGVYEKTQVEGGSNLEYKREGGGGSMKVMEGHWTVTGEGGSEVLMRNFKSHDIPWPPATGWSVKVGEEWVEDLKARISLSGVLSFHQDGGATSTPREDNCCSKCNIL